MIAKILEYALGRKLDGQNECTVLEVHAAMKKADYRFGAMVGSVPFRQRQVGNKWL